MADDVLLNKAATIERCILRAREEYDADPATFASNYSRQDAAILNIQRACEAALDMGQYLIRRERLGITQSSRDVFRILAEANWISSGLSEAMQRMVGFRNIAVHEYQKLSIPITIQVITSHLHEFTDVTAAILIKAAGVQGDL